MISGVNPSSGDKGLVVENVFIAYARIKWKYTKQGIRGGTEGSTTGSWDCSGNKCL